MKIVVFCVATGLACHLPFAAFAQQSAATGTPADTQYCRALAKAYNSMFPTNGTPSVNEAAAMEQCGSNPQAAIPLLEKKLTDWKIELPYDARVAQPPAAGSKMR
jgi:hypothetical protein